MYYAPQGACQRQRNGFCAMWLKFCKASDAYACFSTRPHGVRKTDGTPARRNSSRAQRQKVKAKELSPKEHGPVTTLILSMDLGKLKLGIFKSDQSQAPSVTEVHQLNRYLHAAGFTRCTLEMMPASQTNVAPRL